jgi:hypothetical protein
MGEPWIVDPVPAKKVPSRQAIEQQLGKNGCLRWKARAKFWAKAKICAQSLIGAS